MKRHKPKRRDRYIPTCTGCQWYHEWFGVCCNGQSDQRGDVSERCDLYVAGEPLSGVKENESERMD